MGIQKSKGIVLRTVKYGETSAIVTMYTEMLGIQSFLVKGVFTKTSKAGFKGNFFQTASILDLTIQHNTQKQLQFITSYHWSYLYENVFYNVAKNSVAVFISEILLHSIKQPELNRTFFQFIEKTLIYLDTASETQVAYLPIKFIIDLLAYLGFQIQEEDTSNKSLLYFDFTEGRITNEQPNHLQWESGEIILYLKQLIQNIDGISPKSIAINRNHRFQLLELLLKYIQVHIDDFGNIKSIYVLKQLFN